jgi:hypothetical protein
VKRNLILTTLVLVAGSFLNSPAKIGAEEPVQVLRNSASAAFTSLDSTGCVVTELFIVGMEERLQQPPENGDWSASAELFLSRRDTCTGQDVMRASESGDGEIAFTVDGLASATLRGTVPIFDFLTGSGFTLAVDLSWTGTGDARDTGHSADLPTQTVTRRDAIAAGTVLLSGINLTPNPSAGGAIERIVLRFRDASRTSVRSSSSHQVGVVHAGQFASFKADMPLEVGVTP